MQFYGNTVVGGGNIGTGTFSGTFPSDVFKNVIGLNVERNYGACDRYDLHNEIAGAEAAERIAEVQRRLALLISGQGLGRDYRPHALLGDLFTAFASPVEGKAAARISYVGKGVQGTLRYQHEDVPSDMHVGAHHLWKVRLTLRGVESHFFNGLHQVLMEYIDRERERHGM